MRSCPQCTSQRVWKDGLRKAMFGDVQRFVCRDCGYRFSDKTLNRAFKDRFQRQICVSPERKAKNLVEVEPLKEGPRREATSDIKGKTIEFIWKLKREGLECGTIKTYAKSLKMIEKRGANLLDPESVKDILAIEENWKDTTKSILASAYQKFLELNGKSWKKPKLKPKQKIPFIPLESELDSLIASCGKKTATVLQTLKETGMRIGEAVRLKWTDLDVEHKTLALNDTEKNGRPRMFKLSSKLIAMIDALPREKDSIFGSSKSIRSSFWRQRKKTAMKL